MLGSLERASSDRSDIRRSLSETSARLYDTDAVCPGVVVSASCQAPESQEMLEVMDGNRSGVQRVQRGRLVGDQRVVGWFNVVKSRGFSVGEVCIHLCITQYRHALLVVVARPVLSPIGLWLGSARLQSRGTPTAINSCWPFIRASHRRRTAPECTKSRKYAGDHLRQQTKNKAPRLTLPFLNTNLGG